MTPIAEYRNLIPNRVWLDRMVDNTEGDDSERCWYWVMSLQARKIQLPNYLVAEQEPLIEHGIDLMHEHDWILGTSSIDPQEVNYYLAKIIWGLAFSDNTLTRLELCLPMVYGAMPSIYTPSKSLDSRFSPEFDALVVSRIRAAAPNCWYDFPLAIQQNGKYLFGCGENARDYLSDVWAATHKPEVINQISSSDRAIFSEFPDLPSDDWWYERGLIPNPAKNPVFIPLLDEPVWEDYHNLAA